jgi:hypothetical protein
VDNVAKNETDDKVTSVHVSWIEELMKLFVARQEVVPQRSKNELH